MFIEVDSKIEKKTAKNDLIDAYEGCACSMSGSQTELYYRNDTTIVFFFADNKNERQFLSCFAFFLEFWVWLDEEQYQILL